jgi:hypothetical protein
MRRATLPSEPRTGQSSRHPATYHAGQRRRLRFPPPLRRPPPTSLCASKHHTSVLAGRRGDHLDRSALTSTRRPPKQGQGRYRPKPVSEQAAILLRWGAPSVLLNEGLGKLRAKTVCDELGVNCKVTGTQETSMEAAVDGGETGTVTEVYPARRVPRPSGGVPVPQRPPQSGRGTRVYSSAMASRRTLPSPRIGRSRTPIFPWATPRGGRSAARPEGAAGPSRRGPC